MKEYNPRVTDECIKDCPCWDADTYFCVAREQDCPDSDTGRIPKDCPARGEGILIKVKE